MHAYIHKIIIHSRPTHTYNYTNF